MIPGICSSSSPTACSRRARIALPALSLSPRVPQPGQTFLIFLMSLSSSLGALLCTDWMRSWSLSREAICGHRDSVSGARRDRPSAPAPCQQPARARDCPEDVSIGLILPGGTSTCWRSESEGMGQKDLKSLKLAERDKLRFSHSFTAQIWLNLFLALRI